VFGARADVRRFQAAVHSCIAAADVIHALNDWGRDVFLRNGAPPDRVMRIRTGLPMREGPGNGAASAVPAWLTRDQNARTLRVIYWGRLAWEKGIDVLIAAVRRLPTVPMEVLILGSGAPAFEARLLRLAGGDPRIRFAPPVAPSEVVGVLRQADVGVIPSLWLETGPLTVLEAQAAGLPVIGSRLGGIAELCPEGVGARLFPPGDATALALILDELAGSADALQRLRATVPRPRSMKEVAAELLPVYRRLTESRRNTGQVVGT
jgi:glycosyltransferase involved in cell wall biosynthesis